MKNRIVRNFYHFYILLLICVALPLAVRAETIHLANGQTVTGDIVSMDEKGILLKDASGTYGERTPWSKLSQDDLKELQQNPKAAQFVEPFIEVTQQDHIKKTEIEIKDVARPPRPASHSLIAALFTSVMGIFMLLLVYAGNLYAAYEISIFRARPAGLVCGVSAVAPIIGPIIFLSMPTNMVQQKHGGLDTVAAQEHLEPNLAEAIAADQAAAAVHEPEVAVAATPTQPAAPVLPPTKTFARGQFTFNRRFFETQMPAFFAMTRPEVEKDKVVTVKAARGTYIAQRFSKVSQTDIQVQVEKGIASEDVTIPFVEIQEVQIKHKDA